MIMKRSEEHTSELQSRGHLVCRLLLEYFTPHRSFHSFPTRRSSDLTDHVGTLHDKLSVVGADLLSETLPTIFNKTNESIKQDESLATFAPNISRELERINWQNDHETVYNHVRGLHPWPVAYTTYHNERMKIWWAHPDKQVYKSAVPGEIIKKDESSFTVACGD